MTRALVVAASTATCSASASAQCVTAAPNSTPLAEDGWGQAVAISANGTTAIAGGPYVDGDANGQSSGAVRMLINNAGVWQQQGFFHGGVGSFSANGNLGWSVDMSADGNTAVAGQPGLSWSSSHDGVARVYVRNTTTGTWSEQTVRSDPTPNVSGRFGYAVAMSDNGNTVVVGQPGWPGDGAIANGYVFTRVGTSWSSGVVLPAAPAPGAMDEYGSSVAVSPDGQIIAVGAPGRVNGPMSHGAVHIFRKVAGVWTQEAHLTRTVAYLGYFGEKERFGHAVALYSAGGNETLAVGDPNNTELLLPSSSSCPPAPSGFCMTRYAGCVYLYEGSAGAWAMTDKIYAPDVQYPADANKFFQDVDDLFGSSVALRGPNLIVGAVGDEECGGVDCEMPSNGSVYMFRNGQMLQKLTHAHVYTNDEFGTSVDISDDGQVYIAGAPRGDSPTVNFTGTVDIAGANLSFPVLGVEPTRSVFNVTITFPGNDPPPQTFVIHVYGRLFSVVSSACDDSALSVAVDEYDGLSSTEQSFTIAMPGNQSVTMGPIEVATINKGHAALLNDLGQGFLRGYEIGVKAPMISSTFNGPEGDSCLPCYEDPIDHGCECSLEDIFFGLCYMLWQGVDAGALAGGSPQISILDLDLTTTLDLNMGANNPTVHVTGGINVPLPCPADIAPPPSGDNSVNVTDLLAVIGAWGSCSDPDNCPADINNDDTVNVTDLLAVIGAWGPCP